MNHPNIILGSLVSHLNFGWANCRYAAYFCFTHLSRQLQPFMAAKTSKVSNTWRRLVTGVHRASGSVSLGKRRHDELDSDSVNPRLTEYDPAQHKSSPPNLLSSKTLKLALQVDDGDAVVITALDSFPFCCPNELCSMAREELLHVALLLNLKLPKVLAIDVDPMRPDHVIRNGIEFIVGLAQTRPASLRETPVRSRSLDKGAYNGVLYSPVSPIAGRRGRNASETGFKSPGLESLLEVDEGLEPDNAQTTTTPLKNRRRASESDRRLAQMPGLERTEHSSSFLTPGNHVVLKRARTGLRTTALDSPTPLPRMMRVEFTDVPMALSTQTEMRRSRMSNDSSSYDRQGQHKLPTNVPLKGGVTCTPASPSKPRIMKGATFVDTDGATMCNTSPHLIPRISALRSRLLDRDLRTQCSKERRVLVQSTLSSNVEEDVFIAN